MTNSLFLGVIDLNALLEGIHAFPWTFQGESDEYKQAYFSQVMDHLPLHTFRRCVSRYHGNRYVKKFRCYEQYLVMAFSQLTHRESLRDIEVCPRAHQNKLYHMGISSSSVSRTTLSKTNECRDWRIYANFA